MDVKRKTGKRESVDKPLCKYGSNCYRKNPEHLEKFHPEHNDSKKKCPELDEHTNGRKQSLQKESGAPINHKEALLKLLNRNGCQENSKLPKEGSKLPENGSKLPVRTNVLPSADQSKPFSQLSSPVPNQAKEQSQKEIAQPAQDQFIGDSLNKTSGETVQDVLKSMPPDFFDFWNFCTTINKAKPEDAFAEIGFHLVGIYDLLSKQIPKSKTVHLHCHWRYYYDPPEFQTIIKLDGNDLFHIGYFRDDPSELPAVLASNKAKFGAKLTLMGDNVFAAMNSAISDVLKGINKKKLNEKFLNIQQDLQIFAKKKKYSIQTETSKTKVRQKRVVAKTFHSLGIVVPIKNDVGYRPLVETDASLKRILTGIVNSENMEKKVEKEKVLFDVIQNVHFANDECDFGTGFELGIDLFCFGDPHFHRHVLDFLPLAYYLLKRKKYGEIVHAHLKNRKTGDNLADLLV